jgi:arginase family enzyme
VAIDQVEVNPDRDVDNKTTELAAELLVSLLGGNWDAYTRYIELQKQR